MGINEGNKNDWMNGYEWRELGFDWMNGYEWWELGWLNELVWMKGIRMTGWMGVNEGNKDDWMNEDEWREI